MSLFKSIEQKLSVLRRDFATPGIDNAALSKPVNEAIAAGMKETGQLDGLAVRRVIDATHTFLDQAKSQPLFVEKTVANSLKQIKQHTDPNVSVPLDANDPSKTESLESALASLYAHVGEALTAIKQEKPEKPKAEGWSGAGRSFEIKR